jgi:phosphatidate cytidylyltransferase
MLKYRLISGTLIVLVLGSIAIYAPPIGLAALILVLSLLGLREIYTIFDAAEIGADRPAGYLALIVFQVGLWFGIECGVPGGIDPAAICSAALGAGLIIIFLGQLRRETSSKELTRLCGTLAGLLYVGFFMSFFLLIVALFGNDNVDGRMLGLYMIVVVKATDIGAYATGRAIGRHKVIPRISPGKTWEGCIGGVVVAIGAGYLFYHFTGGALGGIQLKMPDIFLLPALLGVSGIFGDLIESMMKRGAGVKDSSTIVPGMGGVLDILDSLLLGAPVLYFYVLLRLS